MRLVGHAAALAIVTLMGAGAADAKGCIKGAITGGLADQYLAERGVVGAVAGWLDGRYLANRQAPRQREIDYGSRVQPRGAGYGSARAYGQRSYGY